MSDAPAASSIEVSKLSVNELVSRWQTQVGICFAEEIATGKHSQVLIAKDVGLLVEIQLRLAQAGKPPDLIADLVEFAIQNWWLLRKHGWGARKFPTVKAFEHNLERIAKMFAEVEHI